jgi:hypothetical protein
MPLPLQMHASHASVPRRHAAPLQLQRLACMRAARQAITTALTSPPTLERPLHLELPCFSRMLCFGRRGCDTLVARMHGGRKQETCRAIDSADLLVLQPLEHVAHTAQCTASGSRAWCHKACMQHGSITSSGHTAARALQIYKLQARAEAAEERGEEFEQLAARTREKLDAERAALEATSRELRDAQEELARVTAELQTTRAEAASAAAAAADALADAEMRCEAAHVARKHAQQQAADAQQLAEKTQRKNVELHEQLMDAQDELEALRDRGQSVHKVLQRTECAAACSIEPEGSAWHKYGSDAPLQVVTDLGISHLEARPHTRVSIAAHQHEGHWSVPA